MQKHLPCLLLLRSLGHSVTWGGTGASGVDGVAPLGKCLFLGGVLQLLLGSQGTQQQQLLLHKQRVTPPQRLCVDFLGGPP